MENIAIDSIIIFLKQRRKYIRVEKDDVNLSLTMRLKSVLLNS